MSLRTQRIIVVGGGAAGFFAAITCAEELQKTNRHTEVIILEKSSQFLSKVRISGGGRCNVTHACFDPRALTTRYPRGERALIGPFHRFGSSETVRWFEARGVKLKTEADGRMFPITDSSQTIINTLLEAARKAGVRLFTNCGAEAVQRVNYHAQETQGSEFELALNNNSNRETMRCDKLLLATGGCRSEALGHLAVSLGHTLEKPVPSLFSFHIENTPWLRELPGVSIELVEAFVPDTSLRERGPLLITHNGVSGPAILRLSAWGARILHEKNYQFPLRINWLPLFNQATLDAELHARRTKQGAKLVVNSPIAPLTSRLWQQFVLNSGISREIRWSMLSRTAQAKLEEQLLRSEFLVKGKSLNKEEFVTCGGVRLDEVNFKTMESRVCPKLYFAGELLDMDGITGGFNFQAAWTTGWLAGKAMTDSE